MNIKIEHLSPSVWFYQIELNLKPSYEIYLLQLYLY